MIYAWSTADEQTHARAVKKRVSERSTWYPSSGNGVQKSQKTYAASDFTWDDVEDEPQILHALPDEAFYIQESPWTCDSSVTIKTIGTEAHVIKFYEVNAGRSVIVCYIPPGQTREVPVPSGKYEIRYGTGRRWYGPDEMFGKSGVFAKANRHFELRSDNSLELTLYPVANGNLGTRSIREEDF